MFDDRLATVLRHRAAGERAARTQFRQLLDLLGTHNVAADKKQLASAWLRLGALGGMIPAAERAAMVRDPGLRFRNPELAAHLAEDEPDVAAAALTRANLTDTEWQALIPRLPVRARGFLRLRRDMPEGATALLERLGIHDRGLPLPEIEIETAVPLKTLDESEDLVLSEVESEIPTEIAPEAPLAKDSEIGALVKRIEAFRLARAAPDTAPETANESPRLPLGDKSGDAALPSLPAFAFTTDAEGRIDWADTAVAPMVVGKRLDRDNAGRTLMPGRHQPLRSAPVTLTGAPMISGDWIVDAGPRFTTPGGRFYGYAGKFRRPANDLAVPEMATDGVTDRIRQLLHELRTPVNAIQGFAEIIQQQLFGTTPHEYRALAATIAGDSARVLAGFDEMDRLARLESGALELEDGSCELAALIQRTTDQLQGVLAPRTAGFEADFGSKPCPVTLEQSEAEALIWRLLATLASSIGAGETVPLILEQDDTMARLCCELPATLSASSDVFAASAKSSGGALSAGMFGAGFALRLARAEARAAGGNLTRVEDWVMLSLPLCSAALLTDEKAEPSH